MFVTLAFFSLLIGAILLYCTNKNQRFLSSPLNARYSVVGYGFLLVSFSLWYQVLTPASAFFMWLMTLMLVFISTPLLTLLKVSEKFDE